MGEAKRKKLAGTPAGNATWNAMKVEPKYVYVGPPSPKGKRTKVKFSVRPFLKGKPNGKPRAK